MDICEQDSYKFFDTQGRILMLRADMTIPIARVVATKFKDSSLPLRFRYCANVFKVHEQLSGKRNETSECGVELIGVEETCGDLEIIVTALEALKVIDKSNWILEIGNINFIPIFIKSSKSIFFFQYFYVKSFTFTIFYIIPILIFLYFF